MDTIKSIVWATSLKNEDVELPAVLRRLMETEGTTVHLVRINTPGLFLSDVVSKEKLNAFARQ